MSKLKQILSKTAKAIKDTAKAVVQNKRNIGIGIMLVSQGMKLFLPDLMTPEQYNWIDGVGLTIAGVGTGHDMQRKINNNINNAKNKEK